MKRACSASSAIMTICLILYWHVMVHMIKKILQCPHILSLFEGGVWGRTQYVCHLEWTASIVLWRVYQSLFQDEVYIIPA